MASTVDRFSTEAGWERMSPLIGDTDGKFGVIWIEPGEALATVGEETGVYVSSGRAATVPFEVSGVNSPTRVSSLAVLEDYGPVIGTQSRYAAVRIGPDTWELLDPSVLQTDQRVTSMTQYGAGIAMGLREGTFGYYDPISEKMCEIQRGIFGTASADYLPPIGDHSLIGVEGEAFLAQPKFVDTCAD